MCQWRWGFLTLSSMGTLHEETHYDGVIMTTTASQMTSLTVIYSTVYSDADRRKHQSSASLAYVWGIHRDRWIPRTKGQLRGKCFHWWRHHACDQSTECNLSLYMLSTSISQLQIIMFEFVTPCFRQWCRGFDYFVAHLRNLSSLISKIAQSKITKVIWKIEGMMGMAEIEM